MPLEVEGVARPTHYLKKNLHYGVPLGVEGVARHLQKVTLACHLKTQAWHAKLEECTNTRACHLSSMAWHAGVARLFQKVTLACHLKAKAWHATYWSDTRSWAWNATFRRGTLACHLSNQAWHASVIQRPKHHWCVPLEFVAWHAKQRNHSLAKGRGTPDPGGAMLV
ncbi:hypothetical protein AHAS_Ahas06G0159900 [Arachis hypogaea]